MPYEGPYLGDDDDREYEQEDDRDDSEPDSDDDRPEWWDDDFPRDWMELVYEEGWDWDDLEYEEFEIGIDYGEDT
jgi:hypothetical protein